MASLNINKIIKLITREVDIEYCEKPFEIVIEYNEKTFEIDIDYDEKSC